MTCVQAAERSWICRGLGIATTRSGVSNVSHLHCCAVSYSKHGTIRLAFSCDAQASMPSFPLHTIMLSLTEALSYPCLTSMTSFLFMWNTLHPFFDLFRSSLAKPHSPFVV